MKHWTIENGKVTGLIIDEQFNSQGPGKNSRPVKIKWDFEGMDLADVKALMWANFKVVVQRTLLKDLADRDLEGLNGKTLKARDYLTAAGGGKTAKLEAEIEEQKKRLMMIAETFVTMAVQEAKNEGLTDENQIKVRANEIYKMKYEVLVK